MKKSIFTLFTTAFLTTALIGCNQSPLDPNQPVTLNMWHNYGGDMQASMDLLIDEFNSTVGKEEGIIINVSAISSSSELNESLSLILNDNPGAPDMPDIFTGYPKIAVQFAQKDMLCNLDNYFTKDELAEYVEDFVAEGRLSDGGLYVFPLAKSTEIMYVNQTLFDEFSAATGAGLDKLSTFEGIAELSVAYYKWTDSLTPDVENDGKHFYAADSWFNFAEVGMAQLGADIFDSNENISLNNEHYQKIFETIYTPAVEGGIAIYNGYSSDLSKTGDLVCSTGSSAGILFYGDTITYTDGTVRNVEYNILPYPVWEGSQKIALQRGGGLMVAKTTEQKEYAACVFLKWLTAAEQNMEFISKTGYLPVTKQAFETEITPHLETVEDARIQKMLSAVLSMYDSYEFFFAPNYNSLDANSSAYEESFLRLLSEERNAYLSDKEINMNILLEKLSQ